MKRLEIEITDETYNKLVLLKEVILKQDKAVNFSIVISYCIDRAINYLMTLNND